MNHLEFSTLFLLAGGALGGMDRKTMAHLEFPTLFLLAGDFLESKDGARVRAHLERCARCRAAAQEARLLLETVSSDRMEEPPPDVLSRAIEIWGQERPGPVARPTKVLRASL